MCLIIDANKLADTFSKTAGEAAAPILTWLLKEDGCVVYGGKKMNEELGKVSEARRSFVELTRAGRARRFADSRIDAEHARLKAAGFCRSDDQHVIALARISGARVLYSGDKALHKDFKNRRLVGNPGGKVYQSPEHSRVLGHTKACRSGLQRARRPST